MIKSVETYILTIFLSGAQASQSREHFLELAPLNTTNLEEKID